MTIRRTREDQEIDTRSKTSSLRSPWLPILSTQHPGLRTVLALTAVLLLGWPYVLRAELEPSQVFIVYNRNVPASGEIARYYAQQRHIPATQSIGLDVPDRDEITREGYLQKIRDPLRAWLRSQGLQDKIKCIVTVYGMPIRIGKAGALPSERGLVRTIDDEREAAIRELFGLCVELARFVGETPASQPATRPNGQFDLPKILKSYESLRGKAMSLQRSLQDPAVAQAHGRVLQDLLTRGDGVIPMLSMMQSSNPASEQAIIQARRKEEERARQLDSDLKMCPRSASRERSHQVLRELYGLRGLVEHLEMDKMELDGTDSQAALDSELSLLWWDDYPLHRWMLNPLCLRVRHDAEFRSKFHEVLGTQPVVMVARLDGPKPAIVRRMIDDAIATENKGLAGRVYIDARGLKPDKDSYGQYDENLRDLAQMLKTKTSLPVTMDDKPELFAPGTCPDAALYCGWYSLGKYVPAFKWLPGSVAFHIASSEAVSLRDPKAQYWCKRMLEEGVTATLGPVAEPYLLSFPLPHDFFGLLLTGRYTLVECYYMTLHFNSWMQTLLGDPLYTPYKAHPVLKPEDVMPAEWFGPASR